MGVYIPNMDKPKVCHECIAFRYEQGDYEPDVYCEITKEELFDATAIPTDCPLIEIVRCGECKHVMKLRSKSAAEKFGQIYECRKGIIDSTNPNRFCSYGERRTETLDERIKRGLEEWKEK